MGSSCSSVTGVDVRMDALQDRKKNMEPRSATARMMASTATATAGTPYRVTDHGGSNDPGQIRLPLVHPDGTGAATAAAAGSDDSDDSEKSKSSHTAPHPKFPHELVKYIQRPSAADTHGRFAHGRRPDDDPMAATAPPPSSTLGALSPEVDHEVEAAFAQAMRLHAATVSSSSSLSSSPLPPAVAAVCVPVG